MEAKIEISPIREMSISGDILASKVPISIRRLTVHGTLFCDANLPMGLADLHVTKLASVEDNKLKEGFFPKTLFRLHVDQEEEWITPDLLPEHLKYLTVGPHLTQELRGLLPESLKRFTCGNQYWKNSYNVYPSGCKLVELDMCNCNVCVKHRHDDMVNECFCRFLHGDMCNDCKLYFGHHTDPI